MMNRISKKITPAHTHALSPPDLLDPTVVTYDDHVSFEVTVPSTLILVNDLSAAQFVTACVNGTVTSNDTCVVISRKVAPVGSSRFHNFYVSQLHRVYVTTCCHVGSVEL